MLRRPMLDPLFRRLVCLDQAGYVLNYDELRGGIIRSSGFASCYLGCASG